MSTDGSRERRRPKGRHPLLSVGESLRDGLDRLAGERRAAEKDRDHLRAALDAVLAVHTREAGHPPSGDVLDVCTECTRESLDWYVAYPCQTVRAARDAGAPPRTGATG